MRYSFSPAIRMSVLFLFVLQAGGCATTEFFKRLDVEHLQHPHQTRLVIVNHPPLRYYWQEVREGSAYPQEVRRETFEQWVPPIWQSTAREELDSVEIAYRQMPPVPPVTGEIFHRTFQRAFSASRFLIVQREITTLADTAARDLTPSDTLLPFRIPADDTVGMPDWYLALHVRTVGLMRMGIRRGSGLAAALAAAITTAISEKQWSVWLSSDVLLADAQTKKILWKNVLFFQVPLKGSLQEILKDKRKSLAEAIVEGLSYTASIHSAALLNNRQVNSSETSVTKLLLSKSEKDSLTVQLTSLRQ